MSKKVTAASPAIEVNGNYLCLGSDGQIHLVDSSVKKGVDISEYEVAVNKAGMAAIRKAAPVMLEMRRLKAVLSKIKTSGSQADYGEVFFDDENDEVAIRVGCTVVYPEELPGYLKTLGIK